MICAWNELLQILPPWLRVELAVGEQKHLTEIRLRKDCPAELVMGRDFRLMDRYVQQEDMDCVINFASRYSPWAAQSVAQGYLTAPGGHRIGICGDVVRKDGVLTGIRKVQSVCIRVARDYPGIGARVLTAQGSVLILGAPGWGKTTLLRDMVRQISVKECISVVDERGEVFPQGFPPGNRTDILTGASKSQGLDMVLRSMGPCWIAVDEITAPQDCLAILQAHGCGVRLIATAHAASLQDFYRRTVYRPLIENRVFETVYTMNADKSFRTERIVT